MHIGIDLGTSNSAIVASTHTFFMICPSVDWIVVG